MEYTEQLKQLRRLTGQMQGLEKMLNDSQPASLILQQLAAVKGNLSSLQRIIIKKNFSKFDNVEWSKILDYLVKK